VVDEQIHLYPWLDDDAGRRHNLLMPYSGPIRLIEPGQMSNAHFPAFACLPHRNEEVDGLP